MLFHCLRVDASVCVFAQHISEKHLGYSIHN